METAAAQALLRALHTGGRGPHAPPWRRLFGGYVSLASRPLAPQLKRSHARGGCAVMAAAAAEGSDKYFLQNGRPHLPTSLFRPFERLPPDGQTLTPEEEGCDPENGLCKTKIHVWETKCAACWGTGTIVTNGRKGGHRLLTTCLHCTGLGYVRHTSSHVEPVKEEKDSEEYYTLGRPPPVPEKPKKKIPTIGSIPPKERRQRPPRRTAN